jgi:mono/diheme cytochrome c family protein
MWRIVLAVVLLAGCVPGSRISQPSLGPDVPLPSGPAVVAPAAVSPRRFSPGEVLYIRHCADCHGWEGKGGGPLAPLLEDQPPLLNRPELFTRYSEAELVVRILLGKELEVPLQATAGPRREEEVTTLLAHMRRLPTLAWDEIETGEQVYDSLCVSCHGIYGRGDGELTRRLPPPPRDLNTPPYQNPVSDEELRRVIADGRGAMPGAANVLSTDELHAVMAFVRVLSPGYELYNRFCSVCHGPDGHPPFSNPEDESGFEIVLEGIPTFDEEYFRSHREEHIRSWTQHMLKENRAVMPHFSGALNAEEARQILVYLRSLASGS